MGNEKDLIRRGDLYTEILGGITIAGPSALAYHNAVMSRIMQAPAVGEWKPVKDCPPPVGKRVEICYQRKHVWNPEEPPSKVVSLAVYEDGTELEDDAGIICDKEWLNEVEANFDDEKDQFYVPAGWYEELTTQNSEYFCVLDDDEIVTHWRPMPEPPEV